MLQFLSENKWLSILFTLAPAISLLAYLFVRETFVHDLLLSIVESHHQLLECQSTNPEFFRLGRQWTAECMPRVYGEQSKSNRRLGGRSQDGGIKCPSDTDWAKYYCYIEQCVIYCDLVLWIDYRRQRSVLRRLFKRVIGENYYLTHQKITVQQLIVENWPIIKDYRTDKEYFSPLIKKFVETKPDKDWDSLHAKIFWPNGPGCDS